MAVYPNYQIAAGYNNAAGLSSIETVLAGYDTVKVGLAAAPPQAYGRYRESNTVAIRGNGKNLFRGFASEEWPFGFLSFDQIEGMQTNFCSGSYDGFVTIKTRTDVRGTYANFNAVLKLPQLADFTPDNIKPTGIVGYTMRFVRLVAL